MYFDCVFDKIVVGVARLAETQKGGIARPPSVTHPANSNHHNSLGLMSPVEIYTPSRVTIFII